MTDTDPAASAEPTAAESTPSRASPTKESIRGELEASRSQYHELRNSLSAEDWNKKSGNPSWNVRQLMWHLGRGMDFFGEAVGQCRSGKAPNPPGFLLDIGNTLLTRWGSRGATKQSVGEKYDAAHEKLVSLLEGVQDGEWQKGVTTYGTPYTMESVFRGPKEHFAEHAADIKKGLGRS